MNDEQLEQDLAHADLLLRRLSLLSKIGVWIAAFVMAFYAIRFFGRGVGESVEFGQFGDYVGGTLNPLFSFLGLLAILATVALQANELKRSAKGLRESAEALSKQSFESSFFQLLQLHNDIVNSVELQGHDGPKKGRKAFKLLADEFETLFIQSQPGDGIFVATYEKFYKKREDVLGHYFRLLYNIVKHIERSAVNDKQFYANLVRAQLSSGELRLLFYNCISRWGSQKFKPLVECYSLLKTLGRLPPRTLGLAGKYDRRAFAGNNPVQED